MRGLAYLLGVVMVALVAVVPTVVPPGAGLAFADTFVACPTVPPGTPKIPYPYDPTKTASPTGTPCKATSTPTPTDTPTPTIAPTQTPCPPGQEKRDSACVIVGGVAELPDAAELPLETAGSSGGNAGLLAAALASITAGAVALAGAAWCVSRRRAQ